MKHRAISTGASSPPDDSTTSPKRLSSTKTLPTSKFSQPSRTPANVLLSKLVSRPMTVVAYTSQQVNRTPFTTSIRSSRSKI